MTRAAPPIVLALLAGVAACGGGGPQPSGTPTPHPNVSAERVTRLTPAPDVPGDPMHGRELITAKGCAGCHTVSGVPGAAGVAGPVLNNVTLRPTLAGQVPSSPDNMVRWLLDPPAMKPDTTMPRLGLSEDEARDLAAFLYSQPYNPAR